MIRCERTGEHHADYAGQQVRAALAGILPAAVKAAAQRRGGLDQVGRSGSDLAAEREALHQAGDGLLVQGLGVREPAPAGGGRKE